MNKELNNINIGECCVCYKELLLNQEHIITICGHLFCVKCLLSWYDISNACPICRSLLNEKCCGVDIPEYIDNEYNENYDPDNESIFTGDSDDGRFDTIDDYLADDYEWTGVVEQDDLQISTINPEVINQVKKLRQDIIKLHICDIYKMCTIMPKQFNGVIVQNIVNRDKYLDFPVITMEYVYNGQNYNCIEMISPYNQECIYEIVMKNIDDPLNEVHHFCRIRGRKMVNNHFIQNYNDGTSVNRCSLEYAFVVDIITTIFSTYSNMDEFITIKENDIIMFKDIRRLYNISPVFEID